MEFITVRDLRTRPGKIWDKLRQQQDLVLTSNGRPIAVLSHVDEDGVQEALASLRRARAQAALSRLRAAATLQGLDRLSADEIENAAAALKKLDKNGDGKLTPDEFRSQFRGPGGPEAGPRRRPGGPGGGDRPQRPQRPGNRGGPSGDGDRPQPPARPAPPAGE